MKTIITILLSICCYPLMIAQGVGINTDSPDPNAILDIKSEEKGVLLTRLELVTTDNSLPLANHVMGMTTYNTTNAVARTPVSVSEGLYYNDGTKWNFMGPNTLMLGDIKHSLQTTDHKGWFLLNGRNKTSLPLIAQNNASAIGIGTTLPDASDKFIKTNNGLETEGTTAGNNSIVLIRANLPSITYSASTSTNGNHSHSYTDSYNGPKTLGLATNVLPLVPLISETVGTNDTLPGNLYTSANNGSHAHTVSAPSGGSNTPINTTPKHIVSNVFIYLGE
jgi:hypothetical protein